jgi:hypothetical protein
MSVLTNSINANATTPLLLVQGGTQASLTASNGGIVWSNATQLQILAGTATATQVLLSGSSTTPSWSTFTITSTFAASTLVYSNGANTLQGLATANSASLVTTSAGVPVWSSTMTNGQVIIGSTGATPTAATLTAGTGISITNGAGSITVTNTQTSSTMWTVVTTAQTLAAGNGYFANSASQLTFTLPATAAVGDTYQVCAVNTGGWITAQAAGQQIFMGNTSDTSGATGTIASASTKGDWIEIVCYVANTTFYANLKQGEATVT